MRFSLSENGARSSTLPGYSVVGVPQQTDAIEPYIHTSLINQISEEETKYWCAGIGTYENFPGETFSKVAFTTFKGAATARRILERISGHYAYTGEPFSVNVIELEQLARKDNCVQIKIKDESGTVVDSWSVQ